MTAPFRRASIVPFNDAGTAPQDDQAVPLDFNPETLTLKTSAGQSKDRSRRGRQQVQNVGASSATLSFEAVFDSTRPRDGEDGRAPIEEDQLDVRLRTRPLALLIQAEESQQGGRGNKNRQPAPKRVQFRWGSIVFNGLITQYQETFDYFSPGGVPLRSKVQITLTEQEFRYEIDSQERARAQSAASPSPNSLRDAARAAGADSLFELGSGGFSLGLSAGLAPGFSTGFSADISLQTEFGLSADVGLSVGAGISLSADAAVDLFGASALGIVSATAGKAGIAGGTASGGSGGAPAGAGPAVKGAISAPPSPWAPEGPAPGSQAAGLAAIVLSQRAAGIALAAPNTPDAVTPLAPRGSPPPMVPRAPAFIAPQAIRTVPHEAGATGARRPRWEALVTASPRFVLAVAAAKSGYGCGCGGGCGCTRCGED